jgi:2-keto-3-deoxy-galactonokinase
VAAIIFSILAILNGLYAFLVAGMGGHSVGWEQMALYTVPALIFAFIAIAIRRNALTFVALAFGALAIVGFFLGA